MNDGISDTLDKIASEGRGPWVAVHFDGAVINEFTLYVNTQTGRIEENAGDVSGFAEWDDSRYATLNSQQTAVDWIDHHVLHR